MPDFPKAHYNLGIVFMEQGQLAEAATQYQEALRLKPDYAKAHCNLGNALQNQGRLAEAMVQYQEALRLKPDYPLAHSSLLLCLNHDPGVTPAELFAEHCRWAARHATFPGTDLAHNNDPSPHRRLRLGYVSPDFRQHAVNTFMEPILAAHNHQQFRVFCYADVLRPDAVTQRLQQCADTWVSIVGWSDQQVAERIRQDAIDILVDLTGHTDKNRLLVFARKPAPVQVNYLGYPGTTGLSTMDYRLTDAVADPPAEARQHTEELVRLPGDFCCYLPPENASNVQPLPAGRTGRLTFGSLHKLAKLNSAVLDLWCRVLRAVPTARLLIGHQMLSGNTQDLFRRQFQERGIGDDQVDLCRAVLAQDGYRQLYRKRSICCWILFPGAGTPSHVNRCGWECRYLRCTEHVMPDA